MARIRSIKPDIRRSLVVSSWPYPIRWTFVGLPGYLDDEGRGLDDVRLIKAELYPLDDDMTGRKLEQHLIAIATNGPLCRYEVDGQRYMHITSWAEHQRVNRPSPSRIPPCPIHEKDVSAPAPLSESSVSPHAPVTEASSQEGKGKEGSKEGSEPRKRGTTAPDLFPITPELAAWGRENAPLVRDPKAETARFLDYHRAKGSTFKDWVAAWHNWMRNAEKYAAAERPATNGNPATAWAREQG